ncbi:MAG TPA: toxin-antitoxin system HicB family antitoxin [Pseudonocardia sp.]|jgi:hypothetical protein
MDVTQYVTGLREDLVAAAAAGDEQTQRTAALLAAAIEPAARLAVLNALADLAAEVTDALGDRTVEVRLDGRAVRVAVGEPARSGPAEEPPPVPPPMGDPGDISRITLRLVEQIKSRAEQAATAQGLSLNAWISQAVQGALHGAGGPDWGDWGRDDRRRARDERRRGRADGNRVHGWVQG